MDRRIWIRSIILLAAIAVVRGDEFTVTPILPVEVPPLGTNAAYRFLSPGVATFGTNALFVWEQRGANSLGAPGSYTAEGTNFFCSRLGPDGKPIDNPGHFVLAMPRTDSPPRVAAANSGGFAVFGIASTYYGVRSSTNFVTRFDSKGTPQFEPLIVGTNFSTYKIASNGRTLLYVQRDQPAAVNSKLDSLRYRLVGPDGTTLASGVIEGSPPPYQLPEFSFAVASDGIDYFLIWQRATNMIRFAGDTAAQTIIPSNVYFGDIRALAVDGDHLLMVTSVGADLFGSDGKEEAHVSLPPFGQYPSLAFSEEGSWVIFVEQSPAVSSFRLTPRDEALIVERNPYPVISKNWPDRLDQMIAPFGPGRYLVAKHDGIGILKADGLLPIGTPQIHSYQQQSFITASPFGYLIVWSDLDGIHTTVRGLRLAKDGTPLDDPSFLIHATDIASPSCTFDGNDYVIAWGDPDSGESYLARIAPQGQPDVRSLKLTLPIGSAPSVVGLEGKLFAGRAEANSTAHELHIWQVFPNGEISTETLVDGESLVTDGKDLYAIANTPAGQIASTRIDFGAAQRETVTTTIASGLFGRGISLQNGYVVYWTDSNGRYHYSYSSGGVERFHSTNALSSFPEFASSADQLLVAAPVDYRTRPFLFQTFNLVSGEAASAEVDLGTVHALALASAGKDFLAVTDSASPSMHYIGQFWLTSTSQPSFDPALSAGGGGLKANLLLNPDRRYRIETSQDLLNWNVEDVVGGELQHEVANAGADKQFVRAVLVPE